MTSKGQVTIPVDVRRSLDVKAGDQLLFELKEGVLEVRVVRRRKLADFFGSFPSTKPLPGKAEVRRQVARALGKKRASSLEG